MSWNARNWKLAVLLHLPGRSSIWKLRRYVQSHLFPLVKNYSPLNKKTPFGCLKLNTKNLGHLKKCLLPFHSYDCLINFVPVWKIRLHIQEFSSSTNLLSSLARHRVHLTNTYRWGNVEAVPGLAAVWELLRDWDMTVAISGSQTRSNKVCLCNLMYVRNHSIWIWANLLL